LKLEGTFLRSRVARRIVSLFILSALVPIIAMAVLSFGHVQKLLVDQGYNQLAQVNEGYASSLYERLLAVDHQTLELAARLNREGSESRELDARLRRQFVGVAIIDAGGHTTPLLSKLTNPASPPVDADTAHLARGKAVLADVTRPGEPARILMSRALDPARPRDRLLVVELNSDYLWGDAGNLSAMTDFCVMNDRGIVLSCSRPGPSAAVKAFAEHLPNSGAGRFTFDEASETQLANYRELFLKPVFAMHGWIFLATKPQADVLAPIADFAALFVPATLLSLLVVALLSVTQVRRTLVPLEKLIAGTRRAADQDFTFRVEISDDDEFGELAGSFNSMAARLGSQFTALLTLADIDRAILSRLDVDRVLETVVTRMRDIVPADYVSIAVVDRNATAIMHIYTRDQRNDGSLSLERATCSPDDTRELLAHPDGLWLDRSHAVRPYAATVAALGATASFVLPIIWQGAVVGTVVLGFDGIAALSDEERARARDLGDRVGVAFATAAKDEQLYYQAHYDPLTELPNRLYFKDQLAHKLVQAQREQHQFALLFIDLDFFKNVNDSLGHAAGDEVLRQAATRFRDCVRDSDTVARLGGDEFTLILAPIKTSRDAERVARNVLSSMTAPFLVSGDEHFLNASIGIALFPADGSTGEELLRNADTAMYRAKESGRGQYVYFEERMNVAARSRVNLERELRHAIDRNEFCLYYQPQQHLHTGRITGAETLLRWNHKESGLLSPVHFIQLAEETGLIERLGEWVLREACRQFRVWQAEGVTLPRIAVNVSARQFKQRKFVDTVAAILHDSGTPPQCLELEITEGLLMSAARDVEMILGELSEMGVTIALDDFGTGYSSLAYLKRFPVDVVKIDQSFVRDIPADESSSAIVRAIIAMAQALHKQVVAEGVETAAQAEFLRRLKCDQLQGYYVSRPLSARQLPEFLAQTEAVA